MLAKEAEGRWLRRVAGAAEVHGGSGEVRWAFRWVWRRTAVAEVCCRRRCGGLATARGGAGAGGLDGGRPGLERIAGTLAMLGGRSGGVAEVQSAVEHCGDL